MDDIVAVAVPLVVFVTAFGSSVYVAVRRSEASSEGSISVVRALSPIIGFIVVAVPVVFYGLSLDAATSRQAVLLGYFVLVVIACGVFASRSTKP